MIQFCHPLDGGQSQTDAIRDHFNRGVCHPLDGGQSQTAGVRWSNWIDSAIPWTGAIPNRLTANESRGFCHPSDGGQSQTQAGTIRLDGNDSAIPRTGGNPKRDDSAPFFWAYSAIPRTGGNPKHAVSLRGFAAHSAIPRTGGNPKHKRRRLDVGVILPSLGRGAIPNPPDH